MKLFINQIGLAGDGFASWQEGKQILAGDKTYQAEPLEKYKPQFLPPNERRRATRLVRLAFKAGEDAMADDLEQAKELATIFSSSGGDYPIIDQISRTLTLEDRPVSPTQFHNSVHNSAAGYWSIAVGSTKASNSLSAFDASFAMGLIDAAATVLVDQLDSLLVVYDTAVPEPLLQKRAIDKEFAVAFALSGKKKETTTAEINLSVKPLDVEKLSKPLDLALTDIFSSNPAARAIVVLELLAKQQQGARYLAMDAHNMLEVEVSPC